MSKNKSIHVFYLLIIIGLIFYRYGSLTEIYGLTNTIKEQASGPDTFGSIAIPTSRSPYNQKWYHSVKFGSGPIWNKMLSGIASKKSDKDKLTAVQNTVNHTILWGPDSTLWGIDDYWSSPNETIKKGAGDCEDTAILKMMLLRAAGFPRENLYLVVGLDTAARQAHAVLVARNEGRFWVLNERSDRVVTDDEYGFFTPVISMSAAHSWVHGYKLFGAWFTASHNAELSITKR